MDNTFTNTYSSSPALTQSTPSAGLAFAILTLYFIYLILAIIVIVAMWKVFTKANKPGWAAIIPVYNTWVLFEITGYPAWWSILSLVPFVNIFPAVMVIIATFKLGKLFGKSTAFSICLILFPFVTYPILAFGSSKFEGSANPQQPLAS